MGCFQLRPRTGSPFGHGGRGPKVPRKKRERTKSMRGSPGGKWRGDGNAAVTLSLYIVLVVKTTEC